MSLRFAFAAVLVLSAFVGCSSSDAPTKDAGASDSPTTTRCFPGNSNPGYDTACDATTQICVNDYASVSTYPKPNSCQPIASACSSTRTCECILKNFKCGTTTTCSLDPDGLLRVVCQPS